jgi:thioredoxin 1
MNGDNDGKNNGASCGCGGQCGCGGPRNGAWIWLGFLILAGLLLARGLHSRFSASGPAEPPAPAVTVANAPVPAGEAAAVVPAGSGLPRLVDLGAGKCMQCKAMAPILAELKSTFSNKLEVVFIDVWANEKAAQPYGIRLIPTQIFYGADGKERFRHEGFFSREEILAKWKEFGVELGQNPEDRRQNPEDRRQNPEDRRQNPE